MRKKVEGMKCGRNAGIVWKEMQSAWIAWKFALIIKKLINIVEE